MNIFDHSKIKYLPDPVFIENKIKKITINQNKNSQYILNIGRLTKQKNQKILIKAFKKISSKYKKLRLIILGDGEKYIEIKNQIKLLNLKDKIQLIGHSDRVYDYIRGSM